MKNVCRRCKERGKDWNGSDPICAFPDGKFDPENWNCATMNALRDLAEEYSTWNEDNKASVINFPFEWVPDLMRSLKVGIEEQAMFAVLVWYKSRGATPTFLLVGENNYVNTEPTLEHAEAIIKHYGKITEGSE